MSTEIQWHCPRCTLVNTRPVIICSVCQFEETHVATSCQENKSSPHEEFMRNNKIDQSCSLVDCDFFLDTKNEQNMLDMKQDREYKIVSERFHESCDESKFKITRIYRVKSPFQLSLYKLRRQHLVTQLKSTEKMNERWLWHGTSHENIQKICDRGFLRQYQENFTYGRGTYFSKHSILAQEHSPSDQKNSKYLILSRVLVGNYIVGNSGTIDLSEISTNQRQINSTVDHQDDPTMAVMYQDGQAYPEFIIVFVLI